MTAVVTTVAELTLTAHAVALMLTTTAAWCATRQQNARGRRGPSRRQRPSKPAPTVTLANKREGRNARTQEVCSNDSQD